MTGRIRERKHRELVTVQWDLQCRGSHSSISVGSGTPFLLIKQHKIKLCAKLQAHAQSPIGDSFGT